MNRRKLLERAATGGVVLAGGLMLADRTARFRADAEPLIERTLVGRLEDAINVRALLCRDTEAPCPTPKLLNDGRYALPAHLLGDPAYSAAFELLSEWAVEDLSTADFNSAADRSGFSAFMFEFEGQLMRPAGRAASLTMPYAGVFRFEVQENDFAGAYDRTNGSRRSEIVARRQDGAGAGTTVWSSFCVVLGSAPGLSNAGRGMIHQWHSADLGVGRTPVLFVDVANSRLTIRTCSSADLYGDSATAAQHPESGRQVVHYSTDVPGEGMLTFITLQATFGEHGHLNAWINGHQTVDADTSIGYYSDLTDGSGRSVLGYPHWGLYTTNRPENAVVYIANPEWGTASLAQRITSPRAVRGLT